MRKSEEELKAKVREKKLNVPLGSQRWTPLPEWVTLDLEIFKTLGGVSVVQMAAEPVCS